MYDDKGEEVKFVPGQIWLEVLEPGQALKMATGKLIQNSKFKMQNLGIASR